MNEKKQPVSPDGLPTRIRLRNLLEFLPDPVFAFTLDNTVEYINPAFERVFGWTLAEVKGKNIRFIPDHLEEQARQGMRDLFKYRSVHGFETRRYTKDGRILDIVINASLIYDEHGAPFGHILILRDHTVAKRIEKSKQIMFKISQALHSYQELGDLIALINREIKELIGVEGSFILLADEAADQLFFYEARFRDGTSDTQFKKIRFPADQGVSGRVYKTGDPMMIPDVSACHFFLRRVDDETDLTTRNMLSVPIKLQDRNIGVVSVVNKINGEFDTTDLELLTTVTAAIALPIENARIHGELKKSYEELKTLNRAKDKVINHLSHELKTPVAVLGASMKLLLKKLSAREQAFPAIEKILSRARRNLDRILDIQYETEDLLTRTDPKAHHLMSRMVDACRDEVDVLLDLEETEENRRIIRLLQTALADIFGPRDLVPQPVDLTEFLDRKLAALRPRFRDRDLSVETRLDPADPVDIPPEVLNIVTRGLVRNSVEYTPDQGRIEICVRTRDNRPELMIRDTGVGFTEEKLRLIFGNFFMPPDSGDYQTKTPYAFDAGGRGFDLLRMQIFAERFGFKLEIDSKRCGFIPLDTDRCPGDISQCPFCNTPADCYGSGGTTVHIRFALAGKDPDDSGE